MSWIDLQYNLLQFMDRGGFALWLIAFTMFMLWALIIERYLFLFTQYPKVVSKCVSEWQQLNDKTSWNARRIRDLLISQANIDLNTGLALIKVLVVLCPLLGLLGTVIGMLQVFDTMANLGTGNPRAMAAGISRATISTMAGMVVALPGMYFHSQLAQRAKRETQRLLDKLSY
ncbi:MAG: MotA/TolQ/ExbB proton channel family protein [Pseudomonadales bacterium]|nr:MotA/TolQ/ExbB proton channel family protein [Pseudomonadales bacterium]